ncbi:MAG: alpha/beta hydrolase [Planctomycetota bacterium]
MRRLWIPGPAGRLEAALRTARPARGAAIVAHPHPQHGGTLDNPVVFHADRELNRAGLTTLRFNFRGVGTSEGEHDEGRGEVDDVTAALSWLRGVALDRPLLAVGYSFGSSCCLRSALDDPKVTGVIAIGLPVRLYPFAEIERLERPLAVVQGSDDEFGSPDEIRELLRRAHPPGELYVVDHASHLFPQSAPQAATLVVDAALEMLPRIPDST